MGGKPAKKPRKRTDVKNPGIGSGRLLSNGQLRYTEALGDRMYALLADGMSLRATAREVGVSAATILEWGLSDHPFSERFARARELGMHSLIDEIRDIADDGSKDYIERMDGEGVVTKQLDREAIQRSDQRIRVRMWLAERILHKVYGKQATDNAPVGSAFIELLKLMQEQRRAALPAPITIEAETVEGEAR